MYLRKFKFFFGNLVLMVAGGMIGSVLIRSEILPAQPPTSSVAPQPEGGLVLRLGLLEATSQPVGTVIAYSGETAHQCRFQI